jgi:hypothetical protein
VSYNIDSFHQPKTHKTKQNKRKQKPKQELPYFLRSPSKDCCLIALSILEFTSSLRPASRAKPNFLADNSYHSYFSSNTYRQLNNGQSSEIA